MAFENAKWVWLKKEPKINEYAEFTDSFNYDGGKVTLRLCAETDYIVYLNGEYLFNGQFAGYKNEKYYDEDDITPYCKVGENKLTFVVRYEGIETFCHIVSGAGLIYSVECDGKEVTYSSKETLGRLCKDYVHNVDRLITEQLGLTSSMTARVKAGEFEPTAEVDISYNFKKRPIKRIENLPSVSAKKLDVEGRKLYDIGCEECGYIYLKVKCSAPTDVKVAYGEHIVDGCVRYIIGGRDFSFDFECAEGENCFTQYFVRAAGRYLEIFCDDTAEVLDVGMIPVLYPLTVKPHKLEGIDKQIYDISVRTLRLCMHTHYEDCPWREQSLYVLDSRNQMLFGYYAFEETLFQRENLVFMSKGTMPDGMLEITYPAVGTPAIPFFSVNYPVAVCEYVEHTGDTTIIGEVMETMLGIMNRLYSWRDDTGLITNPPKPYWNFYEWSDGNEGRKGWGGVGTHDLIINCSFIYSAIQLEKLCKISVTPFPIYDIEALKSAIIKHFYKEDKGIFNNCIENEIYTVIGNTFAIMAGLGDERTLKAIMGEDCGVDLVPATLSMLAFVYDTILAHDAENGKKFVLDDIYKNYIYMLSCGATSFWETIKGEADFHNAGSLCHGWSAIPVYYFNKFFPEKFN